MQHCDLVKSAEDPNTYLINDTADPLQQSLSSLMLDGLPPSASAAFAPRTGCSPPLIRRLVCGNLHNSNAYAVGSSMVVPPSEAFVHLATRTAFTSSGVFSEHVKVSAGTHVGPCSASVLFVRDMCGCAGDGSVATPWLH